MADASPASNPAAWIEYLNEITQRWVGNATKVVTDAADQLSTSQQPVKTWFTAMDKLTDLALINGGELATTLLAGPGFALVQSAKCTDWYEIPGGAGGQYRVSVSTRLSRFVVADEIDDKRITFQHQSADGGAALCYGGKLPAGATKFRLHLDRSNLRSGCYTGEVVLTPVSGVGDAKSVVVEIEL